MSRDHHVDDYVNFVLELLAPLGRVVARRMFGCHGVYCDGLFVAIIDKDTLWLKADEATRADFEKAGGTPFTYLRAGKPATLNFYSAPEQTLESPEALAPWARLALGAALRSQAKARGPAVKRIAKKRPPAPGAADKSASPGGKAPRPKRASRAEPERPARAPRAHRRHRSARPGKSSR
jgi:DNA transformation protein